jgi:putative addiction module component (TIGR02574 family)
MSDYPMSKSADLLLAAQKLAPVERLGLVEQILDGLDRPDEAVDALWLQEAQDRLAAYRRGEIKAVSLSDVLAKYTAK